MGVPGSESGGRGRGRCRTARGLSHGAGCCRTCCAGCDGAGGGASARMGCGGRRVRRACPWPLLHPERAVAERGWPV